MFQYFGLKVEDLKKGQIYTAESGTRFTHEWGEEMHVNSLSHALNFDLAQPGLEPVTS